MNDRAPSFATPLPHGPGEAPSGEAPSGEAPLGEALLGEANSPGRPSIARRGAASALGVVAILILAALLVVLAIGGIDWWSSLPAGAAATYVGSQSCAECHQAEYDAWKGSHHDLAMAEATAENVLGDFRDVTFNYHGIESRMWRDGDQYMVSTDGPDGELREFPIIWTFGWTPLQQYLIRFPDGRVQCLPISWDTLRKEWFHLYPDEELTHEDPLHWTRPAQNWNYMCADCHSVNVKLNFSPETGGYDTTFDDIDVGCEACHGPGSLHAEIAREKGFFWDRIHGKGLTITLKGADNATQLNACAKCHSRRSPMYPGMTPGDEYLDYYAPELIASDLYYDDGQILDEVYVWGSFRQSRMYAEGVKCTDCHDPHTLRLRFQGNALCTQCHIPEKYDTPEHHHHPANSVGASCVECHMPEKTYMQVDPRRDHSFRVPRPDLSVSLGAPNTCNKCHYDKDAAWAAAAVYEWFGREYGPDDHYAHAFHAGKDGDPAAEEDLIRIAQSSDDYRGIIRASAVSLLRHYRTERSERAAEAALADDEPLVRWAAVQSLAEIMAPPDLVQALVGSLTDPIRIIRMEAAATLSAAPASAFTGAQRAALLAALEEYEYGQLNAHEPMTARFNLGVVYANLGQADRARRFYREAIELDPQYLPARFNLAMLEHNEGNTAAAERELRALIEVAPESADGFFSLGLLLWEIDDRRNEAIEPLAKAVELAPERADLRYNYGLVLQHLGRSVEAERELLAAAGVAPNDTAVLYALAVLYIQQERWPEAQTWLDRLIQIDPGQPSWLQLRVQMGEKMRGG